MIENWFKKLKELARDGEYRMSFFLSFLFFIVSLIINFYAGNYADQKASNPVTDIFLSNVPVYDVSWIFTYGAILFWVFIAIVIIYSPNKIPFTLKTIALFTIIRAVFISLTHIGPFPTQSAVTINTILNHTTFGADLFFSGHTGLPFLMSLIFWHEKMWRYLCLGASVMFGFVVLLGHLHYSIDVLSAFFITYTIFHMSVYLFPNDRARFLKEEQIEGYVI